MKKVNYAAIDIGSNVLRLLIKCVNEENAPELMSKVVTHIRIPLRLEKTLSQQVLFRRKRAETDPADESLQAGQWARDNVVDYRAYATSAMRKMPGTVKLSSGK